jgi:uncharacterized membrane protein YbhN (UPF0104 family)
VSDEAVPRSVPAPKPWVGIARIAVSAVVLAALARWVDAGVVVDRLAGLRPGWVALALVLSVAQMLVLAWRWRLTAARLGLELPMRDAVAEYYLGVFINQVLPGGIVGDVSRAWRHARAAAHTAPAVRAVILERLSAQAVMVFVAIVSVLLLPLGTGGSARLRLVMAATAAAVGGATLLALGRLPPSDSMTGRLRSDIRRALLSPDVVTLQALSALVVVGSYVAVFLVAARAIGVSTPLTDLLPLVAPVLMTMLVPVTVAGWGVREAAAAALWSLAGLSAEEGAAVSVTYGLLVLVSSAPGLVVLMRELLADRGRRAHPPRG